MTASRGVGQVEGERHPAHRLTARQVRTLRAVAKAGRMLLPYARRYGVTVGAAWQAAYGVTWRCLNHLTRPAKLTAQQHRANLHRAVMRSHLPTARRKR
jgi:hypothetical protein